jgi:hypothetical protein
MPNAAPKSRAASRLQNALDESGFDNAWAEGADLSTEEAIAYAKRGLSSRVQLVQEAARHTSS